MEGDLENENNCLSFNRCWEDTDVWEVIFGYFHLSVLCLRPLQSVCPLDRYLLFTSEWRCSHACCPLIFSAKWILGHRLKSKLKSCSQVCVTKMLIGGFHVSVPKRKKLVLHLKTIWSNISSRKYWNWSQMIEAQDDWKEEWPIVSKISICMQKFDD